MLTMEGETMLQFKKVTHTFPHYWALHVTRWFGVKIEPTQDADRRKGIYFLFWYPKSRTRLAYASAWLPLSF